MLHGKRIIGMLNNAFEDYLASRTLFRNGLLLQASILACTCIEKHIKGMLLYDNAKVPRHHDLVKLHSQLSSKNHRLCDKINLEFLQALALAYKARYIGDLQPDYNIVILRRKFLAELDYTYSILDPSIRFRYRGMKNDAKSTYESAIEVKNPLITAENHIVAHESKKLYVEQLEMVTEIRIAFNGELIKASYSTEESKSDNRFIFPALVFDADGRAAKMSHKLAKNSYGLGKGNQPIKIN